MSRPENAILCIVGCGYPGGGDDNMLEELFHLLPRGEAHVYDVRSARSAVEGTQLHNALEGLFGDYFVLVFSEAPLSADEVIHTYHSDPRVQKASARCHCGSGEYQELCCEL